MSVVLDTSAVLGWIYVDEADARASQIFDFVEASGAWVPSIWRLEIANSLQIGVRRGRIDLTFRDTALRDLAQLDIALDSDTDLHAWTTTLHLADRFALTTYDAAYLELALRRGLPLSSLDRSLCSAAGALGIPLVGS